MCTALPTPSPSPDRRRPRVGTGRSVLSPSPSCPLETYAPAPQGTVGTHATRVQPCPAAALPPVGVAADPGGEPTGRSCRPARARPPQLYPQHQSVAVHAYPAGVIVAQLQPHPVHVSAPELRGIGPARGVPQPSPRELAPQHPANRPPACSARVDSAHSRLRPSPHRCRPGLAQSVSPVARAGCPQMFSPQHQRTGPCASRMCGRLRPATGAQSTSSPTWVGTCHRGVVAHVRAARLIPIPSPQRTVSTHPAGVREADRDTDPVLVDRVARVGNA